MNDPAGADECVGVTLNEQLSTHRGIRTSLIEQTTVSGLVESGSGFLLQNDRLQQIAAVGSSIPHDVIAILLQGLVLAVRVDFLRRDVRRFQRPGLLDNRVEEWRA